MITKEQKARILEAYFEKSISKEEMEFLLRHGKAISPKEWVYSNEEKKKKQEQKRGLLASMTGTEISTNKTTVQGLKHTDQFLTNKFNVSNEQLNDDW